MPLQSGTSVGAYKVLRQIGAGGMGEVYRAHDPRLDRDVAIKVLSPGVSTDASRLVRFEQEARAAAALNHPNILAVYDIGRHEAAPYIVSEVLEGQTLREKLSQPEGSSLPARKAIDYAVQIARGLAAAHDKGIVHRDLKPENLFITGDGRAKILDFGLAKLTERATADAGDLPTNTKTDPGTVLGTVGYMSPEQVRGESADHRSDLFAFGVVLYEMLAGKRAFSRDTSVETMTAILKDDPPELPLAERQIPPALVRIVNRCLEKTPSARFQSTTDLAFALEALSSSSGIQPLNADAIAPRAKRSRLAWILGAAVVLAAAGAGVVAFNRFRTASELAGTTRFFVTPPEGWRLAQLGQGGAPAVGPLSVSPDGRQVAFVARDAEGKTQIWLRSLDTLEAKGLEGTEGGASPFWSPDNRFIAFFAGGRLQKVAVAGGPPVTITRANPGVSGSWSSENVIVFSERGGTPLMKVSAAGGDPSPATKIGDGETAHSRPFFLPDGKHFLFRSVSGAERRRPMYVASLDSMDAQRLIDVDSTNVIYSRGHLLFLRDSTLMAVPFDPDTLKISGDPIPVEEGIQRFGTPPYGFFAASDSGVLAYQTVPPTGTPQLTWMDRSGKVLGTVGEPSASEDLAMAPDGKRALVRRRSPGRDAQGDDLWMLDLEREGLASRFTFEEGEDYMPVWSPDGNTVFFNSNRKGGSRDIYRKASSGAGTDELLLAGGSWKDVGDISADGRFLAYTTGAGRGLTGDIWILPLFGDKKSFPYYDGPQHDTYPVFSPDGKWIAYTSNENGPTEVYVTAFDGSGRASGGKRQISSGGGNRPQWRRDGKEIFFVSAPPDTFVMAAAVSVQGANLSVGKVERLIAVRGDYQVSADGLRFLVNQAPPQGPPQPITVVLNWSASLTK